MVEPVEPVNPRSVKRIWFDGFGNIVSCYDSQDLETVDLMQLVQSTPKLQVGPQPHHVLTEPRARKSHYIMCIYLNLKLSAEILRAY